MTAYAGYTKLFNSILHSTIWCESNETKILWITMLAMCDRDGVVSAAVPGLAKMAGVTIGETQAALSKFLSPDKFSRTPDFEGRRIETVPGGWRLLNHDHYRRLMSAEERREYNRIAQQKSRARRSLSKDVSNVSNVIDKSAMSAHTDTDTDTDTDLKASTPSCAEPKTASAPAPSEMSFPVKGNQKSKEWQLTKTKFTEYQSCYPGIDLQPQLRRARQWLLDNPDKQKTARGMPRFLGGWFERSQNRGTNGHRQYSTGRTLAAKAAPGDFDHLGLEEGGSSGPPC